MARDLPAARGAHQSEGRGCTIAGRAPGTQSAMNEVAIFHLANVRLPMEKNRFLLMFAGVNLIFTGLDVALAHSINSFVPPYEWIPVYFAPIGAVTCFLLAFRS